LLSISISRIEPKRESRLRRSCHNYQDSGCMQ
jgi:hypothetical protein